MAGQWTVQLQNRTFSMSFLKSKSRLFIANNDRGANKSLIIHKASQNNRNNIIRSCIWVYLGKKLHPRRTAEECRTKHHDDVNSVVYHIFLLFLFYFHVII